MKIDLHCHTRKIKTGDASTRNVDCEMFVSQVQNAGVSIVAITNHNCFITVIFLDKLIERFGSKRHTDVVPKILAVAPRTVARAITDVNCQCHLVRNFLEYHPSVNVL